MLKLHLLGSLFLPVLVPCWALGWLGFPAHVVTIHLRVVLKASAGAEGWSRAEGQRKRGKFCCQCLSVSLCKILWHVSTGSLKISLGIGKLIGTEQDNHPFKDKKRNWPLPSAFFIFQGKNPTPIWPTPQQQRNGNQVARSPGLWALLQNIHMSKTCALPLLDTLCLLRSACLPQHLIPLQPSPFPAS